MPPPPTLRQKQPPLRPALRKSAPPPPPSSAPASIGRAPPSIRPKEPYGSPSPSSYGSRTRTQSPRPSRVLAKTLRPVPTMSQRMSASVMPSAMPSAMPSQRMSATVMPSQRFSVPTMESQRASSPSSPLRDGIGAVAVVDERSGERAALRMRPADTVGDVKALISEMWAVPEGAVQLRLRGEAGEFEYPDGMQLFQAGLRPGGSLTFTGARSVASQQGVVSQHFSSQQLSTYEKAPPARLSPPRGTGTTALVPTVVSDAALQTSSVEDFRRLLQVHSEQEAAMALSHQQQGAQDGCQRELRYRQDKEKRDLERRQGEQSAVLQGHINNEAVLLGEYRNAAARRDTAASRLLATPLLEDLTSAAYMCAAARRRCEDAAAERDRVARGGVERGRGQHDLVPYIAAPTFQTIRNTPPSPPPAAPTGWFAVPTHAPTPGSPSRGKRPFSPSSIRRASSPIIGSTKLQHPPSPPSVASSPRVRVSMPAPYVRQGGSPQYTNRGASSSSALTQWSGPRPPR
eukprot:Hpha_TRINITY_DN16799_c1_g3::TRINITY_DN16799_c1_g3_i1::g.80627::m.80627